MNVSIISIEIIGMNILHVIDRKEIGLYPVFL
jgi:hypothetical protein